MKINVPRALTLAVFAPVLVTSVIPVILALRGRHIALSVIFLIAGPGVGTAIVLRMWLNIKVKMPLDELIAFLRLLASGDLRTRPSVTDRT